MVIKKVKRIYIKKIESKPIVIRFRRKDGSFVEFKATKIVRKPKRIVFRKVKKVYYRPDVGEREEGKDD